MLMRLGMVMGKWRLGTGDSGTGTVLRSGYVDCFACAFGFNGDGVDYDYDDDVAIIIEMANWTAEFLYWNCFAVVVAICYYYCGFPPVCAVCVCV